MALRKWIVRSLVFAVAGSIATGGFIYERWTNPAAIRELVAARVSDHLLGVAVGLESARLRLLGGIAISELRLSRRDDPTRTAFLYVPSGVIYHDKEQLLEGRLAIRRIDLHRPRLRIRRDASGRWNVAGILPPPEFDQPKPTLVILKGTIVLEDRDDQPPLEIKDVNLTLINDPIRTLVFEGKGASELLGAIQAHGTYQRDTDAFTGNVEAPGVPVRQALLHRLLAYSPDLDAGNLQVDGTARVSAHLHYDKESARPWSYVLDCRLRNGSVRGERVPLPLDQIEAVVQCVDGQVALETLTARSGTTRLEASGKVLAPSTDADCEATLTVEHLTVCPELFARLPESLREIQEDYRPQGPVSLSVEVRRRGGQWSRHCTLRPEEMTATFEKFPYPLERLTGTLVQELDPATGTDSLRLDLVGYSADRPIHIRGTVQGHNPAAVAVDIWGDNLPLDAKLEAALPPQYQKLAHAFHPTGKVDFVATIRRAPGETAFANRYIARFHDATVRYEVFPYPLEQVSGVLDILPDHWEYRDFRGTHKGCEVRSHGRLVHGPAGERIALEVRGSNVLLDEELAAALQPGLKRAWELLHPAGRLDFAAWVDHPLSLPEPELDVTVTPRGCSIRPAFFAYALDQLTGTIRYAQRKVYVSEIQGRHGPTALTLHRGEMQLKPGGGLYVDLADLEGHPIVPEADFLAALPPALARACHALELRDPVALRTRLVVDMPAETQDGPPVIYWDGGLAVGDATLRAGLQLEHVTGKLFCRGRHQGELEAVTGNLDIAEATLLNQPLRDLHSQLFVPQDAPGVLILPNLKARVFGGDLGGQARVEFGDTLRYEVYLTASQVQLEELGRHNLMPSAEISGLAEARLFLRGEGTELAGLRGEGTVDVPSGRMYNLPLLLDLLKVPGLRVPDRTAFEEARARFTIQGPQVHIARVDLYGNAISLSGEGDMNLDGSDINLDFYAVWARVGQLPLPPLLDKLPSAVGRCLLKVKMRGRVGDVKCTKEPLPILVDPFLHLLHWMRDRQNSASRSSRTRPGSFQPVRDPNT